MKPRSQSTKRRSSHGDDGRPVGIERAIYQLDLGAAIAAIRQYNSSATLLAADRLMHVHFAEVEGSFDPTTLAECVVLLDGLWATRLFMEPGASDRIVASLVAHANRLAPIPSELTEDALERDPKTVSNIARQVLPVILRHSPGSVPRFRQNYSFATKVFHWTTRYHFLIVDSRSRARINAIQRSQGIRSAGRSSTAAMQGLTHDNEYVRWILFYSDLIAGLEAGDRDMFIETDLTSQPADHRRMNSLLRILDKVFYIQGGGSGVGRVQD